MWQVEILNAAVEAELEALSDDLLARFRCVAQLVETYGLGLVGAPHLRHVEGSIWEMPLKGERSFAHSALVHVAARKRRVVVVRVFAKITKRTPRSDIMLAIWRAKEAT